MVGFAQLRDTDLGPLEDAAATWRRFSAALRGAQTAYMDNVLSNIRAARWEGAAADAAVRQMTPLGQRIQVASTQADSVADRIARALGGVVVRIGPSGPA